MELPGNDDFKPQNVGTSAGAEGNIPEATGWGISQRPDWKELDPTLQTVATLQRVYNLMGDLNLLGKRSMLELEHMGKHEFSIEVTDNLQPQTHSPRQLQSWAEKFHS